MSSVSKYRMNTLFYFEDIAPFLPLNRGVFHKNCLSLRFPLKIALFMFSSRWPVVSARTVQPAAILLYAFCRDLHNLLLHPHRLRCLPTGPQPCFHAISLLPPGFFGFSTSAAIATAPCSSPRLALMSINPLVCSAPAG